MLWAIWGLSLALSLCFLGLSWQIAVNRRRIERLENLDALQEAGLDAYRAERLLELLDEARS